MKPIGFIKSPFHQKLGTPRQGSVISRSTGVIRLVKDRIPPGALCGLEDFSHIWVLSLFHQSKPLSKGKIRPPALDGRKVGFLACRSPHRPNPIGLTLCKIDAINTSTYEINVSEIDLIDQTPILDIKPYIGYADRPTEWQEGWVQGPPEKAFRIDFSETCLEKIVHLDVDPQTIELLKECLCFDFRPQFLKQSNKNYKIQLSQWDFHFELNKNNILVQNVLRK